MQRTQEESVFSHHEPCPACGSRDNLSRYTSGWGFCSCGHKEKPDGDVREYQQAGKRSGKQMDLIDGEIQALNKRGITEETCSKFNYRVGKDSRGTTVQIASYYEGKQVVAQKIRYQNKDFKFLGDAKSVGLFGMQLWAAGGKQIVITEGEIDAMSVSQAQGNKWPVVSVPNGAQSAAKAIRKNIEYLESFEKVILMFDEDQPGRDAAIECSELFSYGKCKIAQLPLKDANECLKAGRVQDIISAIWNAKEYQPDDILDIDDLIEEALQDVEIGLPWCFPTLTEATYGRRYGEIYGVGAGTGCGKTDFLTQQIAYDIDVLDKKVGVLFLEQKPVDTLKRIAGKVDGKRYHVPRKDDTTWTKDDLRASLTRLKGKGKLFNSFGHTEWDRVSSKIRYMAVAQGIRIFYLDHLTALADSKDEKGSLEQIMKELAGLANELDIMVIFVSHLATPEGKPHEEGGRVMIRHFKGSRAIGFWSYFLFGIERSQQDPDPAVRERTTFRVLKDRYTGESAGLTFTLGYSREEGRLYEKIFEQKETDIKEMFNDEIEEF